jgi:transcriptional regulator with XRE-family HTH domain
MRAPDARKIGHVGSARIASTLSVHVRAIRRTYLDDTKSDTLPSMVGRSIVREARRRAGLSQRRLATLAGVSQPTVARIEGGVSSPSLDDVTRLAAACGLEVRVSLVPADDADWSVASANLVLDPEARVRQHQAALRFARAGQEARSRAGRA